MPNQEIAAADLQPGMILAQDILDDSGRTIVQAATRLTPMLIKRLGKWNIETVKVQEKEKSTAQAPINKGALVLAEATDEDRDFMRRVALAVHKRFATIEENPLMEELKRLSVKHLVLGGRGVIPGLGEEEGSGGT